MSRRNELGSEDWDGHTRQLRERSDGAWRQYCDRLHLDLIKSWIPDVGPAVLKTDLFDEAIGGGLLPHWNKDEPGSDRLLVGIDISRGVVGDASIRHADIRGIVADMRRLPLSEQSFDTVISNSSLDHFRSRAELIDSLREIHRVARPSAHLLITLDNPMNPVIALRRILPYKFLHRLGVLPYPVGATLSLPGLRRALLEIGFVIERDGAVMHVPRVLVIPLCRLLDRFSRPSNIKLIERLLRMETMGRWPTRQFTGHFVAALARKR